MLKPDCESDLLFLPTGNIRPELFTDATRKIFAETTTFTRETCWESVRTPHLFMGILAAADDSVAQWAEQTELDPAFILGQFKRLFTDPRGEISPIIRMNREFLSLNVIRLLRSTIARCQQMQRIQVAPLDLLILLLQGPNSVVAECFECKGVSPARLLSHALKIEIQVYQD